MALPCGSRMPDFRVTVTRAFMFFLAQYSGRHPEVRGRSPSLEGRLCISSPSFEARRSRRAPQDDGDKSALHQHRTRTRRPLVLHQDTQAFCHLGIGLQNAAEIPAETVLVEFLVRLDVPQ